MRAALFALLLAQAADTYGTDLACEMFAKGGVKAIDQAQVAHYEPMEMLIADNTLYGAKYSCRIVGSDKACEGGDPIVSRVSGSFEVQFKQDALDGEAPTVLARCP